MDVKNSTLTQECPINIVVKWGFSTKKPPCLGFCYLFDSLKLSRFIQPLHEQTPAAVRLIMMRICTHTEDKQDFKIKIKLLMISYWVGSASSLGLRISVMDSSPAEEFDF